MSYYIVGAGPLKYEEILDFFFNLFTCFSGSPSIQRLRHIKEG